MKWIYCFLLMSFATSVLADIQYIARFQHNDLTQYGIVIGDQVQPISGSPFSNYNAMGDALALDDVKLLIPTEPKSVFAVGLNFASHMSSPSNQPPPMFLKLPSSLILSGNDIVLPKDATNVHFEGELVLVIGKETKNVTQAEAKDAIFGVMVGNDLTERTWQGRDLQWMRSKASDGFGPISPFIAVGVDYNNVLLTTTLNGKVVQQENTENMIHSPAKVVSYLSQYFTLMPGDLIFMGTPDRTQALSEGDIVKVTIDTVGSVENTIRESK